MPRARLCAAAAFQNEKPGAMPGFGSKVRMKRTAGLPRYVRTFIQRQCRVAERRLRYR